MIQSQVVRFLAAEKISSGAFVRVDESGVARRAAHEDVPIGIAVRCERGGEGGLVVDVDMGAGLFVEPDLAADFDRQARKSLALVRREESIVRKRARREIRRRKQKGRRR